jgi:hypothetical protein
LHPQHLLDISSTPQYSQDHVSNHGRKGGEEAKRRDPAGRFEARGGGGDCGFSAVAFNSWMTIDDERCDYWTATAVFGSPDRRILGSN